MSASRWLSRLRSQTGTNSATSRGAITCCPAAPVLSEFPTLLSEVSGQAEPSAGHRHCCRAGLKCAPARPIQPVPVSTGA